MAASQALADAAMAYQPKNGLLPPLSEIKTVSKKIAKAVALQAIEDGLALPVAEEVLEQELVNQFWQPEYRQYRRTSF